VDPELLGELCCGGAHVLTCRTRWISGRQVGDASSDGVLGAHGLGVAPTGVGAARRARLVRAHVRLALRAGAERRGSGLPLRPTRTGVAARHLALRNSHG
jgi:hypothetical protein